MKVSSSHFNGSFCRVGDILLCINDESTIGLSVEKAEACLKGLPRGLFRLTVMPPPRDVTGEGRAQPKPPSPMQPPKEVGTPPEVQSDTQKEPDGIITETLQVAPGCSMGFEIEGGSETSHTYIYVKSLVPGSSAYSSRFNTGDQLIMVGDVCLIGMTHKEAKQVLDTAPATVEVVAQRKTSFHQQTASVNKAGTNDKVQNNDALANSTDDLKTQEISRTDDLKIQDSDIPSSTDDLKTPDTDIPGSTDDLRTQDVDDLKTDILGASTDDLKIQLSGSVDILVSGSSTEDLKSSVNSSVKTRHTDPHGERHVQLCPEEIMTVELTRSPGEKFGVGIVGGSDNPKLSDIHVSSHT